MSFDQDVAVLNDIVSLRNRVADKRTKALLTSALKRHGRTMKRYIDHICDNGMDPHAVLNANFAGSLSQSHASHSHLPTMEEIAWAQNGEKLRAIKSYRERTGLGLYDSKCAIDKAMV